MNAPELSSFVIAMPTLARSSEEVCLLRSAIEVLTNLNLPLIAADAGSDREFVDYLSSAPGVTLLQVDRGSGSSLVSQVKSALHEATTFPVSRILYTEPDKKWFFQNRLSQFLEFGKTRRDTGIIVASRTSESFATFPSSQRLTEHLTNELLSELFGIAGDFLYGPFLISRELLPYVESIPDDLGWGWRIYLMALSCRLGYGLVCLDADLPCPVHQRAENDERTRLYRMEQMAQNIRGAIAGWKAEL
jgi:hypothetical protein